MIEKTFKAKHPPYTNIADAFESKGVERFKSVLETNRQVLNAVRGQDDMIMCGIDLGCRIPIWAWPSNVYKL